MVLNELIQAIWRGGNEAHEAALSLGLLMEREKIWRPHGDDGGVKEILGHDLSNLHISEVELETIVDSLISYINDVSEPHPMAVWALSKSYDQRILSPLINLLHKFLRVPNKEHLTYQALVGIALFHNEQSLNAIQIAANMGRGLVKETAKRYLEIFSKKEKLKKG